MEVQSPYLQAIQAIAGTVPGEKYRELNLIARRIAAESKSGGDRDAIAVGGIPEPLLPLVQLEIANILQRHEGVVEALKSEDSSVVNRALMMRWFFRGDNKEVISVEYFERNLLPFVCLNTRFQLIKRLAINLKCSGETKLAEDFYSHIATKYGNKQAEPLFIACSDAFIYATVVVHKIVLSCRTVRTLFTGHPGLVISYMKLSKPSDDRVTRNNHNIDIRQYSNFLPRLIKNHLDDFIELLEMHDNTLGIVLSNKAAEAFLKNNVEALLAKPKLYTKLMPLKVVAAKLTKAQYRAMFPKLLPVKAAEFDYYIIRDYLEYYPEQERMSLILDSYKEAYGTNFLDKTDELDFNFMSMLPPDERVRQARIKLAKQPKDYVENYNFKNCWTCYLPIEESVPSFKIDITKASNADRRSIILNEIFYSCKLNDDKEALLDALRFFTTRQRNEQVYVIFDVLDNLAELFELFTLGKDHWAVLNEFIQFLYVKGNLDTNITTATKVLTAAIHFNLIHGLPIEDKILMIIELNMKYYYPTWSLYEKYPEYDRRSLEAFLTLIPQRYPEDHEEWKERRDIIVESLVKSMYEFNARNAKANCKVEKLSIKNYEWLLKAAKIVVQTKEKDMGYRAKSLISILKKYEKDLYNEWTAGEQQAVVSIESGQALVRLAKDPKNILDNWEEYLKSARTDVYYQTSAQRFVRATRWYQDIPIKFMDSCLRSLLEEEDGQACVVVLGILMNGAEFAGVVEPLLPKHSKIDTDDENAKTAYSVMAGIARAANLTNPPIPLELILNFCDGDYLNLGLVCLTNACCRTALDKVEPFAKTLSDRRVSVKKHGIRLFCMVASVEESRDFLTELWKVEKHRSIRAVVFGKIFALFLNQPSAFTWAIMKNCVADFTVDDDDNIDSLMDLRKIPDEFVIDHIKLLLDTLDRLELNGFGETRTAKFVAELLRDIHGPLSYLLDEDFARRLLEKYFCNPNISLQISKAGVDYAINGYLRPDKEDLETRLRTLCGIYEESLRKYWNVQHPTTPAYYPVNYLSHEFVMELVVNLKPEDKRVKVRIMEALLKSFLAVLKPQCDVETYTLLTLGVALKDANTLEETIAKIVESVPGLVKVLTSEAIPFLPDIVARWILDLVGDDSVDGAMYDLMEALCRAKSDHHALLAAAILLATKNRDFEERRAKLIEYLRESKHPAVASLVYIQVNTHYPD